MKRIIAALIILATVLALASCSFKELTPEEKMSSVAAEESKRAEERSSVEAAIEVGKKDILDEIGKSKKDKKLVVVKYEENFTEYRVIVMDKNGFGDYMEKYIFYNIEQYKSSKNQESFGADELVDRDDDLRMLKFKRDFDIDSTYENFYKTYEDRSTWTIVE